MRHVDLGSKKGWRVFDCDGRKVKDDDGGQYRRYRLDSKMFLEIIRWEENGQTLFSLFTSDRSAFSWARDPIATEHLIATALDLFTAQSLVTSYLNKNSYEELGND